MPVLVLIAGQGMQIDDGVDPPLGAELDDPVELREPLRFDHARVHVVLELAVVDRDPDQIEPEGGDVARVRFREVVLVEGVEEQVVLLLAHGLQQDLPERFLVAGIAVDEVLHVQHAAEAEPAQADDLAFAVDQLVPFHDEQRLG